MKNVKSPSVSLRDPRMIASAAMFIALNVILTRYLSIQTDIIRIGFEFLPVALFAILYGPLPGAVVATIGDVVGFFVLANGAYMPTLTLCAFVYGFIYGLFLHRENLSLVRIMLGCTAAVFVVDLVLKTYFLSMLYGFEAVFIPRVIKCAVMLPIQITAVYLFNRYLSKPVRKQLQRQ